MSDQTPRTEGPSRSAAPPFSVLAKPAFSSLKGDRAFRRVRNKGQAGRSGLLSLRWLPGKSSLGVVVGIVVSRKVGKAVTRNLVRRRLREAARRMDWPACQAMVVANPEAANASYAALFKALRLAASKSGLAAHRPQRGQPSGSTKDQP